MLTKCIRKKLPRVLHQPTLLCAASDVYYLFSVIASVKDYSTVYLICQKVSVKK